MEISELMHTQTLTYPDFFESPKPAEVAHFSLLRIGTPSLLRSGLNPLLRHTRYAYLRIYTNSSLGH